MNLTTVPQQKLKDVLHAKFDPVQVIIKSGVFIIHFRRDEENNFFIYE